MMFSTVGDIMINVGDILSTVGDTHYRGGYHDARGGYHEYSGRKNLLLFEYPHGTEHPPRYS